MLTEVEDALPADLPLGIRQRLSLAVAVIHRPEMLILDEPTSGVDPVARDMFWQLMVDLARQDQVTIFISTHFMNEAERCDRISLMHAGKVLASDTPQALVEQRGSNSLEEAFIAWLKEAQPSSPVPEEPRLLWHRIPDIRLHGRPSVFAGCLAIAAARRWSCAAIRYDRRWRCWGR